MDLDSLDHQLPQSEAPAVSTGSDWPQCDAGHGISSARSPLRMNRPSLCAGTRNGSRDAKAGRPRRPRDGLGDLSRNPGEPQLPETIREVEKANGTTGRAIKPRESKKDRTIIDGRERLYLWGAVLGPLPAWPLTVGFLTLGTPLSWPNRPRGTSGRRRRKR